MRETLSDGQALKHRIGGLYILRARSVSHSRCVVIERAFVALAESWRVQGRQRRPRWYSTEVVRGAGLIP